MPEPRLERLVFFGNERLASGYTTNTPTLRRLIAAGYEVCAVVSNHERGRSRQPRELEVAAVAAEHGIPLLTPAKPADILEQLYSFQAVAGILVAYGRMVPQSIIDIFPRGIINIHPSLLPRHRGSIPVEAAMLEGAVETGVSLMALAKAMDAGPVYHQSRVALSGRETKQELTTALLDQGADDLLRCLPAILRGELVAQPQDEHAATYDQLLSPSDAVLDFTKPAQRLEREVRAYAGWPKSRTLLAGKDVVVTQARLMASTADDAAAHEVGAAFALPDKTIGVQTSEDILVIERLTPAGKPEMTAAAFLAGNTV